MLCSLRSNFRRLVHKTVIINHTETETFTGFRRTDDIFNQPFYFDHSSRLHSKYAKFHPSYIKFVEDAMLVLFLLCVLVTLLVVHRGSCYRYYILFNA